MKKIYFDKHTLKGAHCPSMSTDIVIQANQNISKVIPKYDKDIQKTDKNGNFVYLKNIYETVQKEKVIGTEIVTEVTDIPYIQNVWKTNEDGFKLYSQLIYGEDGIPTGETEEVTNFMNVLTLKEEVDYYERTDKIIGQDEEGNDIYEQIPHMHEVPDVFEYNKPIYIEIHAEDEEGNKLYIKEIKETWEEEQVKEVVETTENIQVFSYIEDLVSRTEKEFVSCDHECNEECVDGCVHSEHVDCNPVYEDKEIIQVIEVPEKFEENKPCMVPTYKDVVVDIFSNPEEFTIIELLSNVYEQELANSNYQHILADMFINDEDIDFEYENHAANTGAFTCCLHPRGSVRLKELELETPANIFEILGSEIPDGIDVYINDVKLNNNRVKLPSFVDKCIIRFDNTTDKYLDIKSYCIAY